MPKKILAVCGDSFQSIVDNQFFPDGTGRYIGTHWSEHVAKDLDMELYNLACQKASNTFIVVQVLSAIKRSADFIVVSESAAETRLDLYMDDVRSHEGHITDITSYYYSPIFRTDPADLSPAFNDENNRRKLTTMSWNELEPDIRDWFAMKYPLAIASLQGVSMISYAIRKIIENNIPFLYVSLSGNEIADDILPLCNKDNIVYPAEFNMRDYIEDNTPGYHTTPESQVIIADYIKARIERLL